MRLGVVGKCPRFIALEPLGPRPPDHVIRIFWSQRDRLIKIRNRLGELLVLHVGIAAAGIVSRRGLERNHLAPVHKCLAPVFHLLAQNGPFPEIILALRLRLYHHIQLLHRACIVLCPTQRVG